MGFSVRSTGSNNNNSNQPKVDWEQMNKEIVEIAALQQPETLIGIISGIYDVGIQPQPDAQYPWTGTKEEEEAEIAKDPSVYFQDLKDYQDGGKIKRFKLKPMKPAQSVVMAIDFPDIIVDKGKYFGNSDPKPLRLILGGEFTPSGSKTTIAAKPLALTIRKNEKTNNQWSIPFNNTIYKMAIASKLINQGEPFLPEKLDQLLGKAMQFKAQVFLREGKYFTEKCAFAASLSRGQVVPEYDTSLLHVVQFDVENSKEDLNQLRASVKNTMRQAEDFSKHIIKDQIGEGFVKGSDGDKGTPATPAQGTPAKEVVDSPQEGSEVEADPFDDDGAPF